MLSKISFIGLLSCYVHHGTETKMCLLLSKAPNAFPCFFFYLQTLYKTQVRELKEECEERNKLYKDAQQSLQDMQEER